MIGLNNNSAYRYRGFVGREKKRVLGFMGREKKGIISKASRSSPVVAVQYLLLVLASSTSKKKHVRGERPSSSDVSTQLILLIKASQDQKILLMLIPLLFSYLGQKI